MAQQPVPTPPRTYDDLCALPEDGLRHELIEGVHYVTPSPILKHQKTVANLFLLLGNHVRGQRLGLILPAPMDVYLSPTNVVEPDILFVCAAREAEIVGEKNITGAPDLVVEVLSPGTRSRDEKVKRDFYGKVGCREYWLVDPEVETLRIYRQEGGGFPKLPIELLEGDDVLRSPLFPGFELTLSTIFA